jgi:flavorubredoxin
MRDVEGIETAISDVEAVDLERVTNADAIVIGAPNHFGGPTRTIRKFMDQLGQRDVKAKWGAVFDTYMGGDFEKAVKKMEKRLGEKISGVKLIAPGLSIKVGGMQGPIVDGELPKCKEFGEKIADQLDP